MKRITGQGTFPLAFAERGERVSLVAIRAGRSLRKRLADLGLTTGMDIRIVQEDTCGPLILAIKEDSRLALERPVAQRIMVRRSEGGH
jgi:Fe2+ transport system protein FeoA